jgi:hypothetical protein
MHDLAEYRRREVERLRGEKNELKERALQVEANLRAEHQRVLEALANIVAVGEHYDGDSVGPPTCAELARAALSTPPEVIPPGEGVMGVTLR